MIISRLQIQNLRNIEHAEMFPHGSLNYIYGDNGAGKTSILEALSVLSRGRSFRTSQPGELTGPLDNTFRVFAESSDTEGHKHRIGLERSGSHWKGRVDGNDVRQLSQLSLLLPTVVMEPDSHLLVGGAPENRRKYLDWGMFHVEHGFLELWRNFSRALKQRNAALRSGQENVLDSIDEVLAEYGNQLGHLRERHADKVSGLITGMLFDLKARVQNVEIHYEKGWKDESYLQALQTRRKRDLERGATGAGPHRADLRLLSNGVLARTVLSRGEQKAFAAAMLLTQVKLLGLADKNPVLLLDDLVSEFDKEHFEAVLDKSVKAGCQVWVSGTGEPNFERDHKVFHVEQGRVKELV